jgi:Aspartyl protease
MRLSSVAALVLTVGIVTMSSAANPAPAHKAIFKSGSSSTGWIDFDSQDGKRIFIPAKINGHETTVLLATGLPISDIDKSFAASIGLQPEVDSKGPATGDDKTAGLIHGIQIQIGDMTLQDTTASPVDFAPLAKHMGHPLPLLLGDDAFNELAVDIDFAHHRIAFSNPASQAGWRGRTSVDAG